MKIAKCSFILTATVAGSLALSGLAQAEPAVEAIPPDGVLLHKGTYFEPAPIEETWSALHDPAKRKVWFGYGQSDARAAKSAPNPSYFQRSRVDHPGLPGPTETITTAVPVVGGTAVTQIMIGLGGKEVWRNSVDPGGGIAEMMGDLALYLRTGAGFPRHTHVALRAKHPHPNDFSAGARDFPGGVQILDVPVGTLGAEAGMQAGDVLVAFGDVGIYNLRDLDVARAGFAPGDIVEVAWIRGDKVMRGSGRTTVTPIKWRNGFDPAKMMRSGSKP